LIEINAVWSSDSKLRHRLKKLLRADRRGRTRRFNPDTRRTVGRNAGRPSAWCGRGAESIVMYWLLLFIPVAAGLEYIAPERHLLVFAASSLAILPLAGWLGRATEQLAERLGEGVGGLLNATFGNAAELIIALAALRAGLHDVVKASIAGSIIGNMLLVLGAAMLAGGLRHSEQHFNPAGARSQATMLTLAAIALTLPAAFQAAVGARAPEALGSLSVSISLVLLLIYLLYLVFTLITHAPLFAGSYVPEEGEPHARPWPMHRAALVLAAATIGIAWMSEVMVGAIQPTAHELGFSSVFIGVFVVAIVGNAAEHATAISVALKNRMDLSLSIAIGSSVQVALFVAPVLVLTSLFLGPAPMDLALSAGLVLTLLLSVLITGQVAGDGRSDWLKGAQLLAVYLVLGLTFFFMPAASASP
jgi:Ca2+:H+ antiporter